MAGNALHPIGAAVLSSSRQSPAPPAQPLTHSTQSSPSSADRKDTTAHPIPYLRRVLRRASQSPPSAPQPSSTRDGRGAAVSSALKDNLSRPSRRRESSSTSTSTAESDASPSQLSFTDEHRDSEMQPSWLENNVADERENRFKLPSSAHSSSPSHSPLSLIPSHRAFSKFIRRHEIPRKALHVSIGFLVTKLYVSGIQPSAIRPVLMGLLIPITLTDVVRHRWARFNRLYLRVLGPLMRETEVSHYNGVIFYIAGAWAVLQFCPKDVSVLSILMLSWCDTAASTFGRLLGRYTPKVRKGKSLAGSVAALVTGVVTAVMFWGWLAPRMERFGFDVGEWAFAFRGMLRFPIPSFLPDITFPAAAAMDEASTSTLSSLSSSSPSPVLSSSPWSASASTLTLTGPAAVGVASLWAGLIASASEAVDLFGLDDNLTIPVLCGVGIWGFLKLFG